MMLDLWPFAWQFGVALGLSLAIFVGVDQSLAAYRRGPKSPYLVCLLWGIFAAVSLTLGLALNAFGAIIISLEGRWTP
jgi:hypothetical protein